MQYGESLADLANALKGRSVDAVLLMCSNPEAVSAGLPLLIDSFDGPVGAYPNLGYNPDRPPGQPRHSDQPEAERRSRHLPARWLLALEARRVRG